ncbi:reverse transcriptase family protein [Xenorhabdus bovienii]|uniref:RNA-directed DNA polymerase n=2 Tax=Xenorhabdus TaxID=626 RepID=A0A077QKJ3_XENBV|nr:reverse transcriptase family protein [Xenorhabdus bovienii]CDH33698.1 conserved hypothetical protein [Xenorhabdus bovienii str. Intermedium]
MTKESKLKIVTRKKSYTLQDSPFYKLKSKKKLTNLLKVDMETLLRMMNDTENYNEFEEKGKKGKVRKIQHPVGELDVVHTRIASLICRIATPSFLHSGKKQHSNVGNARIHCNSFPLMTTDVCSFFPSTKRSMVFSFFYTVMECSSDVADILSHICTIHGHLPTGSRISMPLAYWANCRMFSELEQLAIKHNVTMTLYVDDLTFSGNHVNPLFKSITRQIIERHGHQMHPTKTKLYRGKEPKLVTGIVIKDEIVFVRNEQRMKLVSDITCWKSIKDIPNAINMQITLTLLGRLYALSSIDPKFKDRARTIKANTQK